MNVGQWYLRRGRMDRRTYWLHYFLPILLAGVVAGVLDTALGLNFTHRANGFYFSTSNGPIGVLVAVAVIVPSFASLVTRLHDRGHSAWWLLWALLPFAGAIVLLVQTCLPGQPGSNAYGPPPAPQNRIPDPPYPTTYG